MRWRRRTTGPRCRPKDKNGLCQKKKKKKKKKKKLKKTEKKREKKSGLDLQGIPLEKKNAPETLPQGWCGNESTTHAMK